MRRMFSSRSVGREAEVLVQAVADVVAVEHVGQVPALDQGVLEREGDGALARRRRPVNQRVAPFCCSSSSRSSRLTCPSCQVMLVALIFVTIHSS